MTNGRADLSDLMLRPIPDGPFVTEAAEDLNALAHDYRRFNALHRRALKAPRGEARSLSLQMKAMTEERCGQWPELTDVMYVEMRLAYQRKQRALERARQRVQERAAGDES